MRIVQWTILARGDGAMEYKLIQWMNFSERRDGALAKMTKPLYYNIVTVFLSFRPHFD
jgi:hypothetical protein